MSEVGVGAGSAAGAGWLAGRGGRPEGYCHRQMIDAVRYLVDNGIKWRAMPSVPALAAGVCLLRPLAGVRQEPDT
ncbi:hypothetical protein ACFWWT_47220 [Streptomyces sp. NPDC058676]|uniref:hypothetical protein n=1 Tax=Streptomyces sp. NPDC058676 TaxID=3346593 RepID=UPI003648BFFD